jgi:23S rRNA (adenine2503-C2)-methyltransferase
MGCAFCASTIDGCSRDVTAGEMHAMAAIVNAAYAGRDRRGITNVVLMGSGEPLDNYDNVVRFVRLLHHPKGMGISPRNVSLSTCGLVERIDDLSCEDLPLTLSLSLHAPNDAIRRQIMPIAFKYTVGETTDAVRRYALKTGRRAIIEYTMIAGLNDAPEHARELAVLLRGMLCHVNLIPLNPVKERPQWKPPTGSAIAAFSKELDAQGIGNTVRRALGDDIQGACGQLRRRHMEDDA